MIDENTKVNEDVKFDTYDGKDDSPKLKLTDKKVESGFGSYGEENGLSPNPDGSGYIQQIEVDSLSDVVSPKENVLYIVGDKKFKYLYAPIVEPGTDNVIIPAGWVIVDNLPNLHLKDGGQTPAYPNKESQEKKRPKIFNEPVAFQDDVFIKGEKIGKAYNHQIFARDILVHIVTADSDAFTKSDFAKFLYKHGFTSNTNLLLGSGIDAGGSSNQVLIYERAGFYSPDGEKVNAYSNVYQIKLSVTTQPIQVANNQTRTLVTQVSLSKSDGTPVDTEVGALDTFTDKVI